MFNKNLTASLLLLISVCFSAFSTAQSAPVVSPAPEEGKEFARLTRPVVSQPEVVEFFSFYCGPCYRLAKDYPVAEAINHLMPEGQHVVKYHVSAMGPLGNELTEAWAIAQAAGKRDELEKPLFEAVQSRRIKSVADIQRIFARSGIDPFSYEIAQQSQVVKTEVARQNAAMQAFSVTGTPSFYVKGKYIINNGGIEATTADGYVRRFASVVHTLLATDV